MKEVTSKRELLKGVLQGKTDSIRTLKNLKPMQKAILEKYNLPTDYGRTFFEKINGGVWCRVNGFRRDYSKEQWIEIQRAYGNNTNFFNLLIK